MILNKSFIAGMVAGALIAIISIALKMSENQKVTYKGCEVIRIYTIQNGEVIDSCVIYKQK